LVTVSEEKRRREFLTIAAPLRLPGVTGSLFNPLAVFGFPRLEPPDLPLGITFHSLLREFFRDAGETVAIPRCTIPAKARDDWLGSGSITLSIPDSS